MTETMFELVAQSNPWFTNYGLAGAILGGGAGVLGGVYGSLLGVCAPRGRARGLVLGLNWAAMLLGAVLLTAGLVALGMGQPYGVWYPMTLSGAILTIVMGCLLPVARLVYRQADLRRLQAEEFRRG